MAVKSAQYAPALTADISRGPSIAIWDGFNIPAILENPGLGMYFFDDFIVCPSSPATGSALPWGSWAAFLETNGAITDGALEGGVIKLAASTTAHQGVSLNSLAGSFRITTTSTLALNKKLAFEARVAVSSIAASQQDTFVGLMDTGGGLTLEPITATGGLLTTTPNLIGFHQKGGASGFADWNFVYQLGGGTAVYPTNLQALITTVTGVAPVAAAFVKLGFIFDPNPPSLLISSASTGQTVGVLAKPMIQVFVNGQPAPAFLTSTNVQGTTFPTGFMGPVMAFKQQSTTASISSSFDWIRVAQGANS